MWLKEIKIVEIFSKLRHLHHENQMLSLGQSVSVWIVLRQDLDGRWSRLRLGMREVSSKNLTTHKTRPEMIPFKTDYMKHYQDGCTD